MNVGEFRQNLGDTLSGVVSTGQPDVITWHRTGKPYVTLVPPELFDDLVAAAGDAGQDVLKRHREDSEQQEQEAAA